MSESEVFLLVVASVCGFVVGGMLNTVIMQSLRNEPLMSRVRCMRCQRTLPVLDFFPMLGYVRHKGTCRYCRARVPTFYPWGEWAGAALFATTAWQLGSVWELVVAFVFVAVLLVVVQTDVRASVIPNSVVFTGIALIALLRIWIHSYPVWHYVTAFLLCGGLLLVLAWLSRGGMGGGDIKLFALIGLVLGLLPSLLALFISSLLGIVYGLVLTVMERKIPKGKFIPFGPFMAIGAYVSYMWGEPLLAWSLRLWVS